MADIFPKETPGEGVRRPRGRSHAIDDGRLWGQRDALVFLAETTWPEIGGRLAKIKTAADVYEVVKTWEQQNRHNTCYVAQVLLRPSAISMSASTLNEKRRRGGELHSTYREAEQLKTECRNSLETAQRAYSPDLNPEDRASVEEQIAKRAKKLADAEEDLDLAQKRHQEMQILIEQGEAHFARTEFALFCRSKRYRLTPLNLANALAGLPYISWRQSLRRCQQRECPGVNGGAIQEFDAIRRIVRSGSRRSQLVKHAEQWLISKGNTKSHAIAGLRNNWYYLRKAIQTALDAQTRSRDLPFVITMDFRERQARASNVDRLFAEEEAL